MHSRNAQNSYQLHKKVLVKKTDTFYCCLENNTVAKSKLINIILVQSILHILQLRCGHTDYRFPLSLSCDYTTMFKRIICAYWYLLSVKRCAIIIFVKERWRLFRLPCERGCIPMAEITYLFVLAIVFVAFNEVIKNIKK